MLNCPKKYMWQWNEHKLQLKLNIFSEIRSNLILPSINSQKCLFRNIKISNPSILLNSRFYNLLTLKHVYSIDQIGQDNKTLLLNKLISSVTMLCSFVSLHFIKYHSFYYVYLFIFNIIENNFYIKTVVFINFFSFFVTWIYKEYVS